MAHDMPLSASAFDASEPTAFAYRYTPWPGHPSFDDFLLKYAFVTQGDHNNPYVVNFLCLGAGAFGAVFECYLLPTDPLATEVQLLCVKILRIDHASRDLATAVTREVRYLGILTDLAKTDMEHLSDPEMRYYHGARHVVQLEDHYVVRIDTDTVYLMIVLEKAPLAEAFAVPTDARSAFPNIAHAKTIGKSTSSGIELYDLRPHFQGSSIYRHVVLRQALSFLRFLHDPEGKGGYKFLHRDIKLENILVWNWVEKSDGITYPVIKIVDFGLLREAADEMTTSRGTPRIMAPEMFDRDRGGFYDEKVDIFGLGCAYYYLTTGRPPEKNEAGFPDRFPDLTEFTVVSPTSADPEGTRLKPGGPVVYLTPEGSLLRDMTVTDPNDRLTALELLIKYGQMLPDIFSFD